MSYIGQIPLPQATEERIERTATAGQTSFTGLTYVNGHVSVYLNGVKLDNADFTATDGTTVTLGTGAAAGDTVSFVSTTQTSALVALPLKDSSGAEILSESGSTVTLANVDTATIGSNALVVDSSGNVLVGKNQLNDTVAGLAVTFSSSTGRINLTSESVVGLFNRQGSTGDLFLLRQNNNTVGTISVTGSSTAYNTSSDYRLKENITDITDGISRLKQLNPSRFNFKADPNVTVDGFLAHEVSDIVPEAVSGEKDAVHEDGSIDPQGIDQSKLVPLLTAAIQEAIGLIESQQSQIDALIARIEALETT